MKSKLYDLVGAKDERFSPYCWRARMACAHKGLIFDTVPTTYAEIAEVEDGGHKTLPILRDDVMIVGDSWAIATYLEDAYPDGPTLFGGEGGLAVSKFVDSWAAAALHPIIITLVIKDIHNMLDERDKAYFRESREKRFGRKLEDVQKGRDKRVAELHKALTPMALMLRDQPFIGGDTPLYADYVLFGSLQWPRMVSSFQVLPGADSPVTQWFERCLDLHGGIGRTTKAAA